MSGQEQVPAKGNNKDAATDLGKLPQDVVTKLSEKLSVLMGEDVSKELNQLNNGRGELLNEEGLPIIDITEPVETSTIEDDKNVGFVEEPPLPPLHLLPETVKERLRQERNHLLDQLEEEERSQQMREEVADMERREEIIRKREEAAAEEKDKLKATKEMQKKMGRMLLQNLAKEREQEEKTRAADAASDEAKRTSQGDKIKKTVSFADTPDTFDNERSSKGKRAVDWGDITPARLRTTGRPSLLSSSNDLTMKMTVVERTPSAPSKLLSKNEPDSDDESDTEAQMDDEDSEPEETLEDEEYDADFAHHQREIALQYHEKREKIGAAALAALKAHSHDRDEDVRVDLPLDMPSFEYEKPSVSRFKASRLASSYAASSPSTSISASVVPASAARTIQKAVRSGKLDADDQLVGDADSASEEETTGDAQGLLDLLRKGELYNIGPDGNYLHVAPPSNSGQQTTETASLQSAIGRAIPKDLPLIDRPKISKFKLSRPAGQSLDSFPLDRSPNDNTPVSAAARSPSKMPPPVASSVVERKPAPAPLAMNPTVSERPVSSRASVIERRPTVPVLSSGSPSMIVDSLSFPAPAPASVPANDLASSNPPFPMIIDSPSFSKSTVSEVRSRPTRPPTVVSSAAREASKESAQVDKVASQTSRTDELSRFMAERTQ
ncbi:hypothetical protein C0989_002724 [Termitomyces sp. Mn162]|nr:hypothetical protein C0989_002724 [Termitomyces sp. Mn162]